MPQKRNPDVLELVRSRASRVQACASAVMGIVQSLPGGYNRDLQDTKEPFMEGVQTTRACLRILTLLVPGIQVNREALRKGFTPDVFATDRALELVAGGMPFRDAYDHVKAHLGELAGSDPAEAIRAKTHEGATAGLDLALLRARAAGTKRFVKREKARYYSALSKLLGATYPALF